MGQFISHLLLKWNPILVYCHVSGIAWQIRRVLDFLMEFIDLYTTGYNSLQIAIWHTVIFILMDIPRVLFWLPNELSIQSQIQSHIETDGQSVSQSVSQPWCRAQSGAHDQIFITFWQLRSCYCGAPSLTRSQICLLSESLSAAVSHLS
jgi:hypothetical protein